ncbi:MAG: hypothetical protein ABI295_01950 [Xanthomarina sp.]
MKSIIKVLLLSFVLLSFSCSSSDDSPSQNDSQYPITLKFTGIESNDYVVYKNGAANQPTQEELDTFHNEFSSALNPDEIVEIDKDVYFKFLSDTELESVFGDDNELTIVPYVFEDSFLYAVDADGNKYLLGQGTKEKLVYRYYAYSYQRDENGRSGGSDSYEDEDNKDDFPATFDLFKDLIGVNSIEEMQGEKFLIIQNLASSFEKRD